MIALCFGQGAEACTRSFSPELTPSGEGGGSVGDGDGVGSVGDGVGRVGSREILAIKSPIANAAPSPATPNSNQRKFPTRGGGGGGGGGVNTGGGPGGGGGGGGVNTGGGGGGGGGGGVN